MARTAALTATNHTIYFDPPFSDEDRRRELFAGQLIVLPASPRSLALIGFARQLMADAFSAEDPRQAQHRMPVEEFHAIIGKLMPAFINHRESKTLIRDLLGERDCDIQDTYFDVPRMRAVTSDGYLTAGFGKAWPAHRDTWYSAPACQINWWIPIFPITPDNAMAFHPRYFNEPVENNSGGYNYYRHNAQGRGAHLAKTTRETRVMPEATGIDMHPQIRVVAPAGSILLFSGAQLHSSVPNDSGVTRFSIDFRTIALSDAAARRGAPSVDVRCGGTNMRDFKRAADLAEMPDDVVGLYDDGTLAEGMAVYQG